MNIIVVGYLLAIGIAISVIGNEEKGLAWLKVILIVCCGWIAVGIVLHEILIEITKKK